MNNTIKTEIALGILFIVALVIGGLVFAENRNKNPGSALESTSVLPLDDSIASKNDSYYVALAKKCNEDTCCLDSVSVMKQGGFKEIKRGDFLGETVCQYGSSEETTSIIDSLSCVGSLAWCSNDPVVKKKWQEIQARQKNQNQEVDTITTQSKEECEKKAGKQCSIVLCDSSPECKNIKTGWQPIQ